MFALVWGVLLKQECRRKGTFAFEGLLRNRVYVPTEDCHVEHDDLAKGPLLRMAKIRVWGFGVRVSGFRVAGLDGLGMSVTNTAKMLGFQLVLENCRWSLHSC